jgi:hypothetical protein
MGGSTAGSSEQHTVLTIFPLGLKNGGNNVAEPFDPQETFTFTELELFEMPPAELHCRTEAYAAWLESEGGLVPAYTSHGHEIRGSVEDHPRPEARARCGGPAMCAQCQKEVGAWRIPPSVPAHHIRLPQEDADLWTTDTVRYNENTLFKVRDALKDAGLDDSTVLEAVIHLQNQGLLFRERMP